MWFCCRQAAQGGERLTDDPVLHCDLHGSWGKQTSAGRQSIIWLCVLLKPHLCVCVCFQILRKQGYDAACDIWSLGILLYTMIAGLVFISRMFWKLLRHQVHMQENSGILGTKKFFDEISYFARRFYNLWQPSLIVIHSALCGFISICQLQPICQQFWGHGRGNSGSNWKRKSLRDWRELGAGFWCCQGKKKKRKKNL